MAALWTEACLTFPPINAIGDAMRVYPAVDAIGGTSPVAHDAAFRRIKQASPQLITCTHLLYELQRD